MPVSDCVGRCIGCLRGQGAGLGHQQHREILAGDTWSRNVVLSVLNHVSYCHWLGQHGFIQNLTQGVAWAMLTLG